MATKERDIILSAIAGSAMDRERRAFLACKEMEDARVKDYRRAAPSLQSPVPSVIGPSMDDPGTDFGSWYIQSGRSMDHQDRIAANPIVANVAGIEARFPVDDSPALAKWIKGTMPKAPRKARKATAKLPDPVSLDSIGKRAIVEPTASATLISAVLRLLARIEEKDGEGNMIPDYFTSPVRVALEGI